MASKIQPVEQRAPRRARRKKYTSNNGLTSGNRCGAAPSEDVTLLAACAGEAQSTSGSDGSCGGRRCRGSSDGAASTVFITLHITHTHTHERTEEPARAAARGRARERAFARERVREHEQHAACAGRYSPADPRDCLTRSTKITRAVRWLLRTCS